MMRYVLFIFMQSILISFLSLFLPSVLIIVAIFLGFILTLHIINTINFKSNFDLAYVFGIAFVLLMTLTYLLQIGICTTVPNYFNFPLSRKIGASCLAQNYFQITLLALWLYFLSSVFSVLLMVGRQKDSVVIVMMFFATLAFTSIEIFERKMIPLVMIFFGLILNIIFFSHRTYSSIWNLMAKLGIYLCLYGLMNAMSKAVICISLTFILDQNNSMAISSGVCRLPTSNTIFSIILQTIFIMASIMPSLIHYMYYVSYKNSKIL